MFSLLALYFAYRRAPAAAPQGDVVTLTPRAARTELPLAA